MRDSRSREGSDRWAGPREWWSFGPTSTALPPVARMPWNSPVLCSLWALDPGIQPPFQSVGHLIMYRRCDFPEGPMCGPLKSVSPPRFLEVPLEGLTDGSSVPTLPAGQT